MAEKSLSAALQQFEEELHGKSYTAEQFQLVWDEFDKDKSGYIEGNEIELFLRDFLSKSQTGEFVVSDDTVAGLTKVIMQKYDTNADNKIEMSELAELLRPEENFLLLFRTMGAIDNSVDFMETWRKYDTDKSGCIESQELTEFLRDIIKRHDKQVSEEKLKEYSQQILKYYDKDNDGKLQFREMTNLLPVKQNFLKRFERKCDKTGKTKLNKQDFENVFNHYDRDGNGMIEGDELKGFLKDLMEHEEDEPESQSESQPKSPPKCHPKMTDKEIQDWADFLVEFYDRDKSGSFDLEELRAVFLL
ncbi:calretinin-like isoform X2 [Antedon mediterranea]|uniref:calretinin-like isoform X2 n=1 Tax=Antedon mediterranea TaxID=105859 RepID=UPI003AF5C9E7